MSDDIQKSNETSEPSTPSDSGSLDSQSVGPVGIVLTVVYLVLLSVLLIIAIIQFWPVSMQPNMRIIDVCFLLWTFPLSDEGRLLLIVVLAGALGGQVRSIRSLAWYIGNKQLKRSWLAQYILTPFVGAILAVVAHFIIRGSFCPANSTVQETNIFGFTGLAGLIGIASEPVAIKLKQAANTLFTKPIQGKDSNPQE